MNAIDKAAFFLRGLAQRLNPYAELARVKKELCEANQKIESLATKVAFDGLTGLWSRVVTFEIVNNLIADARRNKNTPIDALLLDLDNFGEKNKRFGNAKGDEILATVGAVIRQTLRPHDLAIRIGGEELLIVAERAHDEKGISRPNGHEALAQRLLTAIAEPVFTVEPGALLKKAWNWPAGSTAPATVRLPDGIIYKKGEFLPQKLTLPVDTVFVEGYQFNITASIGIASLPTDQCPARISDFSTRNPDQIKAIDAFALFIGRMVDVADNGMQRAKNDGKNCFRHGIESEVLPSEPFIPTQPISSPISKEKRAQAMLVVG